MRYDLYAVSLTSSDDGRPKPSPRLSRQNRRLSCRQGQGRERILARPCILKHFLRRNTYD